MPLNIRVFQLNLFLTVLIIFTSSENLWHSYQLGTGYGNREELVITDVAVNDNFKSGDDVKFWKSVSLGKKSYAVGLMNQGFTIVKAFLSPDKKDLLSETKIIVDSPSNITNIELFQMWNKNTSFQEVILIVLSQNSKLSWYSLNELELGSEMRSWTLHINITYLQHSIIGEKDCLILISDGGTKHEVLIYEFDGPNLRLTQAIPLASSSVNLAVTNFGAHTFISIPQPQEDTVQVYQLKEDHFVHYQNISAAQTSQVKSFKIGFKSFIAINGNDPGIYQFTKQGLVLESYGLNLEGVKYWLTIPVKTYRDEVILIGQRIVHHGPHKSIIIEPLIFNGVHFILHEEMPCSFYGATEKGLACMVDEESESGLIGYAVLNVETMLGVLVPAPKQSRLFTLNTILKELKSPVEVEVERLHEMQKKLQQTIEEQQNKIKLMPESFQKKESPFMTAEVRQPKPTFDETILGKPQNQQIDLQLIKKDLEDIQRDIKSVIGMLNGTVLLNEAELHFGELALNGDFEIKGPSKFNTVTAETLNDEVVLDAFNDMVRKHNFSNIKARKTFTDVHVDSLTFQHINGHSASDVVHNAVNSTIVVHGNLVFEEPLEVLEDVHLKTSQLNGYNLDEMVQMNKKYLGQLTFESVIMEGNPLTVDTITVGGNLSITNINDEHMETLKHSICFTNVKNHIPGDIFVTEGVLNVTGELQVNYLNNLKFPEEYVLQNSESSKILGNKVFIGNISVQQLLVDGKINDIDPDSLITLNEDQELTGSYLFHDMEVTESFGINGNVSGPHINEFLENPILTQTNEVKARITFKSLEVDGVIVISGNLNENDFADLLGDVVYADEDHSLVTSIKEFPRGMSVTKGIHIDSNTINSTPLDQIVTSNTEQIIDIQTWNGDVEFKNLNILGLYDGINLTQLDEEAVKLTGEQFVQSTLTFENLEDSFVDVSATDFIITNSLNNLPVENYLFTSGESRSISLDSINFESVLIGDVIVDGDVFAQLNDFSVEEFDARRVSSTRNQTFTAKYEVDYLETSSMKAKFVNGVLYEKLFDIQYYADVVSKMLIDGKLKITNLHVNGSILAQTLNGIDLGILQRCFWTNKNNNFKTIVFMGDVFVKSLNIEKFNSVNFKEFSYNIVRKPEKNLTIKALKTFTNGFHVVKYIDADRLNSIPIDDIFTKSGSQEMLGSINIYGDVIIHDTEIHENLNDISINYLTKTFEFVDNTLIVNDDMVFNRLAYIDRLWIDSYAENHNVTEFLTGIVYVDQNHQIPGTTVFEGPVYVKSNLMIEETINKVDLSEFLDEVVFVTKPDTIDTSIIFNQRIHIENDLFVASNLDARFLLGIDLENWKGAAFVNEGMIPGKVSFESVTIHGEVFVNNVNDLDMTGLVPLRTDQAIDGNLVFGEIKPFHDILVGNTVNGYKLADLFTSTVFMNVPSQIVTSPIKFAGNVLVRNHLHIMGLMNGKNLSNIVTTGTEQNLTSQFIFKERVTLDSNLMLPNDKINNISLLSWQQHCVLLESKPQEIYNRWIIGGNVTFKEDVDGTGVIGGFNVRKMADDVEAKRFYKSVTEKNLAEGYINMCKDVNTLIEKAQNQIYLFKYFEKLEPIQFTDVVKVTHHFVYAETSYLLVSEVNSCTSTLFIWNKNKFTVLNQINTGVVDQFISVNDGNLLFIVSNGPSSNCEVSGTNVWKFHPDYLVMPLYHMAKHQLLHDSLDQGTFYGLLSTELIEYKVQTIVDTIVKKYRKWSLETTDNVAFVPRGIGIGLALYNSKLLMKLLREDLVVEDDKYGYETNEVTVGKVDSMVNNILPVPVNSNLAVLNVGTKGRKRSMLAVASHEETSVKGKLDFIKVYEDISNGKLFHKVPAYKPSFLTSIEFGNSGETLLLFLENKKVLQVFEYKGIEGFLHRTSINLHGSKLLTIKLPMINGQENKFIVGVVSDNQINFLQAEMSGNQLATKKIDCDL